MSDRVGRFIAIEGGEGTGKTTQIELLAAALRAAGHEVVVTHEPGGTALGRGIRELLLAPGGAVVPRAEALLYAADRAQHAAEVIAPALRRGAVVVSDRYVDSSLAYQGIARNLGVQRILELSRWATAGVMPHVSFYLDLPPEQGLARVGAARDRIESEPEDFHRRVRDAYLELARLYPERLVVIDAGGSPSQVHGRLVAVLEERLGPMTGSAR